jgi:hypothetical protein
MIPDQPALVWFSPKATNNANASYRSRASRQQLSASCSKGGRGLVSPYPPECSSMIRHFGPGTLNLTKRFTELCPELRGTHLHPRACHSPRKPAYV